ncbi:hypothetical protein SO802_029539 [Lithocarpus litseifolius]|uniref:AAA+ ATPase domain-containing protein n=1 Tax=Lithocarpus litseifolius TaxID=425828 RepID=A0AAW2BTE2_9ROSI
MNFCTPEITPFFRTDCGLSDNHYDVASTYLRTKIVDSSKCLNVGKTVRQERSTFDIVPGAEAIQEAERVLKLYSRDFVWGTPGREWSSIILEHPTTFEKLAMDPVQKRMLKDDLDKFVNRKEWYKKIGKARKRGYLLYGPPGTGKSSLIAAMANYLKFDVYDLDLSRIRSDSELRRIFLSTSNRSIMVIEDIDCAKLEDREIEERSDQLILKSLRLTFFILIKTSMVVIRLLYILDSFV